MRSDKSKKMADALEGLYLALNRRQYVHPDPLEFLYAYPSLNDREIVALVASSLAYGRVSQILTSVSKVLHIMGPEPCQFIRSNSHKSFAASFRDFSHRFATGKNLSALLMGVKAILKKYGSLQNCLVAGFRAQDDSLIPALVYFARALSATGTVNPGHLVAHPERGSACKRLHLFLRWMIRQDAVDPGGWSDIPAAKLIVPLDTHMHRIGTQLGFTKRKQPDVRAALEITARFRQMMPHDPVRYDFTLTRGGIRKDPLVADFLKIYGQKD